MKKFKLLLLAGLLAGSFAACTGNSDRDGYPSIEGSADPANDGGRLGGDDSRTPKDSDTTDVLNK